jgi:hypothetical protein
VVESAVDEDVMRGVDEGKNEGRNEEDKNGLHDVDGLFKRQERK